MTAPLRLYVWDDVLTDYTSGVMFALASSVEEARELLCPGWNAAEQALRDGATESERPGGHYFGSEHHDLRAEPTVHDEPVGRCVWGGG